jgi:hypothetical protein
LTFDLFGPNNSACTGTPVFTSSATVTGNGTYHAGGFNPSAVGAYRFVVSYSGDSLNSAVTSACGAAGESTAITLRHSTLTARASASVTLGGSISDTATVTTGLGGAGSITFRAFGPGDTRCAGSPAFTATVMVSGNGSYPSSKFKPKKPGTYLWTATYGGNATTAAAATACGAAGQSEAVKNPSNKLKIVHVHSAKTGAVTVTLEPPGPGKLTLTETAGKHHTPFARRTVHESRAGKVTLTLKPKHRPKAKLTAKLTITFTPTGGTAGTRTVGGLRI